MGRVDRTSFDIYKYSYAAVLAFGILGNTLVVISIMRKKSLLKSNYYFLVFQLAICDLMWSLINFLEQIVRILTLFDLGKPTCSVIRLVNVFSLGGIYMMLAISVLRYRAVVHPLKPAISSRKLRVICGFGYIVALIVGYGTHMAWCLNMQPHIYTVYGNIFVGFTTSLFYLFPTVFMGVIYYKICRALLKQNDYMKRVCSIPVRGNATSSFKMQRYARNRRTFLVCLAIVLCYGVGNLPFAVVIALGRYIGYYQLDIKHFSIFHFALILRAIGTSAINPIIYGTLDKKLLQFWKLRSKKVQGRRE